MGKPSTLLSELLKVDVFKIGEFMLKGNHASPFYIDLRHIPSYPKILNNVVKETHALINQLGLDVGAVCGVPYNALPFASVLSSHHEIPLLLKRKEAKTYGTKKLIEGVIVPGTTCLIIEDVVVSGASIKETADVLRKEGLVVTDCITILDRLQGGKENLLKLGIKLHSLFDIHDILSLYCSCHEVCPTLLSTVRLYLEQNICSLEAAPVVRRTFSERSDACCNPVLRRLFEIIQMKKSNLCVAVDVPNSCELLRVAEAVAPHICMLKTHIDVLIDFSPELPLKLQALALKHNFLILEDRKFADISDTVVSQYLGGIYSIAKWADVVTVHGITSPGVLEQLKGSADGLQRACLLTAQMNSKGSLIDDPIVEQVVQLAESEPNFVIGFVSQNNLSRDGNFLRVFPELKEGKGFKTPEEAVADGADIVIVGKEICLFNEDVTQTAIEYKNRAYNAYMKSCATMYC